MPLDLGFPEGLAEGARERDRDRFGMFEERDDEKRSGFNHFKQFF